MLVKNYVGGTWTEASATDTLPVTNPASGEEIGRTPLSAGADVDAAVRAAQEAFPAWRSTPSPHRARVLFRLKMLLEEHKEDLARRLTTEHGKIVAETPGAAAPRVDHAGRELVRRAAPTSSAATAAPTATTRAGARRRWRSRSRSSSPPASAARSS